MFDCAVVTLILCCNWSTLGSPRRDDCVNTVLLLLASSGCVSCFCRTS